MDDFRSTRTEALVLLGGYDIDETTEQVRGRLTRYYTDKLAVKCCEEMIANLRHNVAAEKASRNAF